MGAVGTGAIGPVSVRYAAQIRQLLFAQAIQRMAADQEAARARAEPAAPTEKTSQPLRAKIETSDQAPARSAGPGRAIEIAAPAQLVDIQA